MRRHPPITRRTRLRLTLLAILSLLFQQAAFASYFCAPVDMPANDAAMSMHCQGMPMVQRAGQAGAASALCSQHCAQQTPVTHDAQLPNVPPSQLPAILSALPSLVALPVSRTAHARMATRRTPGISPPLRYRMLLI